MIILTHRIEYLLFENHKEKLPVNIFGRTELFTKEMQKEYIELCKTDEGEQYLEGGSKYNPKHRSVKYMKGDTE